MGKTIWAIVAIVLIGLGAAAYYLGDFSDSEVLPLAQEAMGVGVGEPSEGIAVGEPTGEPVSAYTVRYTDAGFSPATLTVPLGTTVTFIDQGSRGMWVGSDEHPTHTNYSGTAVREHCENGIPSATAFDQCGAGAAYSFTFDKTGTWGYHNHRQAGHTGTIVVE